MTRARCPYEIGGTVTGWTVVPPEGRTRRQPEQVTGTVVQIGSGRAGVDCRTACLWLRLPSGRGRVSIACRSFVRRRSRPGAVGSERSSEGGVVADGSAPSPSRRSVPPGG